MKVEQAGHTPARKWYANVSGGSFVRYATTAVPDGYWKSMFLITALRLIQVFLGMYVFCFPPTPCCLHSYS